MIRLLLCSVIAISLYAEHIGFPKHYYQINNTAIQKEKFVEILLPLIEEENRKIAEDRLFIVQFFNEYYYTWSASSRDKVRHLAKLAKKYKIKSRYQKEEYLKKIDQIPTSMVLAQAAVESAWGKSRFVTTANNIFGQWTYGKHGIVPKNREVGKHHKIRIFNTLEHSIAAYMLNLNRNRAYTQFRKARLQARASGLPFTGEQSSDTMTSYSGIGKRYNAILKRMIASNGWQKFDQPFTSEYVASSSEAKAGRL